MTKSQPEEIPSTKAVTALALLCLIVAVIPFPVVVLSEGWLGASGSPNKSPLENPGGLVLVFLYVLAALASPIIGLGSLAWLGIRRRSLWKATSDSLIGRRNGLVIAAAFAVVAPVIWLFYFPAVFFASGGSR
jgi:hypothetical protein